MGVAAVLPGIYFVKLDAAVLEFDVDFHVSVSGGN